MWHKFYQSPVCNGLCFRFLFWNYLLERCFLYSCCTSVRLLHLSDTVLCLYQRSSILLGCIYLFVELSFVYEHVSRALIRYTIMCNIFCIKTCLSISSLNQVIDTINNKQRECWGLHLLLFTMLRFSPLVVYNVEA